MKKLMLIIALFTFSACTNDKPKLLDENSATPDQVKRNEISEPVVPVPDLNKNQEQETNSSYSSDDTKNESNNQGSENQNSNQNQDPNQNNKQSTMTNPRTSISPTVELKDLAAEYTGAILKTSMGDITIKFYADESPLTVNNFLNLAQAKFYDGMRFHRVIKDFMIQGGDPNSKDTSKKSLWGTGGPEYRFKDEFNSKPLVQGSLAMANAGPATNGSQFFIVTKETTPWLDGKHTNFGEVTSGLDVVMKIDAVETDPSDKPLTDVLIETVELIK